MNQFKALFCLLTITLSSLIACDGDETTECICTDDGCECPADFGLEKTEVFVTYLLKDGQEASKAGMEVTGTYQLLYEGSEPTPISCETLHQNTTKKVQCSVGSVPVETEISFMIMIPDDDKLVAACQSPHRSECRGTVKIEVLRENGQSEFPEDILATDGNFDGNVAYRFRILDE